MADQLFFLGVHGDHWVSSAGKAFRLLINVGKLRISIRIRPARIRAPIRLQPVAHPSQQLSHRPGADWIALLS
jgi:hypothetical protein